MATPPISPSPRTPTSGSSLHPPSSFNPRSLLRRASGALRGAGGPVSKEESGATSPSPSRTTFNDDDKQLKPEGNNTLSKRLSLSFLRPGAASLEESESSRMKQQMQHPIATTTTTSNSTNAVASSKPQSDDELGSDQEEEQENRSLSFPSSRISGAALEHLQPNPPASPNSSVIINQTQRLTPHTNSNPNSNSNSNLNSNFLSPKAASLLLSPDERAFRGGGMQSNSNPSPHPHPHHPHLTPEECAFRGIQYVPIPASPNSALANLATGTITGLGVVQKEGKWGRFKNAVSNSRDRDREREKEREREEPNGHNGLGLRGFMRSPSPAARSPSQSPEFSRDLPLTSSKAEKLLGISSPTSTSTFTAHTSVSKAEKFLGITSASSPSNSNFNPNSKADRLLRRSEVGRSRALSSASRFEMDHPFEMQSSGSKPVYSTPPQSQTQIYASHLESQLTSADQNRSRSGSTASSSFFAEDSSNPTSSSSFLGLGLSNAESESHSYHSEVESSPHSDFLGDETSSSGVALGLYESGSGSSSPIDRTPSSEWGTFFPSLTRKESKDRLKESKEREKEKEKERLKQLLKLKERRKENERKLRERSYDDISSDGIRSDLNHEPSSSLPLSEKLPNLTDYSKDPVTPIPSPFWNSKLGKDEDRTEFRSTSPVKSKSKNSLVSLLGGNSHSSDPLNDFSLEKKSKTFSRVHASDLVAQFNLEKTSSPKKKVKSHAKTRSSSSIERFETPVKKREVLPHQRQHSTPKPSNLEGGTSIQLLSKPQVDKSSPQTPGKYVPVQLRKPIKGLFNYMEQERVEEDSENQVVHLRPQELARADSFSSRKRLSSLLCEGFDLVLDSDLDARSRAQEALQAIVDDDDASTCASSDFEGEDGIGIGVGDEKDLGGYVSAEEGEQSPNYGVKLRERDVIIKHDNGMLEDDVSQSSVTTSFATAQVKPGSQKRLVPRKSPEEKLLPLPPLPDNSGETPKKHSIRSSQLSTSRALATLNSLPPLSTLVGECLSADSAASSSKPKKHWSGTPMLSNSSTSMSTSKVSKLLSSSSNRDQTPRSWVGYVRAYSRGEFELSHPPKPKSAPIVSFPTPRMATSPNLVSPSLLGTGRTLRHQRSSSSFARFDGTYENRNFSNPNNLPSPSKDELHFASSPLPVPSRNGAKTPPVSSASPLFGAKSPRKSSSNSNLPRLSFASPSTHLDHLGHSYGSNPTGQSEERMRMSREDEESIRREAEEVGAVGGEGDIRAPRPPDESERQESAKIYVEALKLDSTIKARSSLKLGSSPSATFENRFDGMQLIAQRLAQDLDVQCSGITLLDDSIGYLLASVGIDSDSSGIRKGLGFEYNAEEPRTPDPKLSRSPSGKQLIEGLGVEFEEEREELAESSEELEDESSNLTLPRDRLFDAHTILSRDGAPFVILDTLADWRFERREGASDVRFYAGVSIFSRDGMPVGSIFVAHPSPRAQMKREDKERLLAASREAAAELEVLRRIGLKRRLSEMDESLLLWAKESGSTWIQDQSSNLQAGSNLLASPTPPTPMSLMTLAARRGARVPSSLSVPPSPNPPNPNVGPENTSLHPAHSTLQRAVNIISETLSALVYVAKVGSDPLACSVVVRSDKDGFSREEDSKELIKSEADFRRDHHQHNLNPDAAAHLCALAATKRGISIHRDPNRVAELLGLFEEKMEEASPAKPTSTPALAPLLTNVSTSLESAIIVPAGLKEGGRMWRGTEGWVLGVALKTSFDGSRNNISKAARLGPEVSIYLLRFASLLAPLLLEGPRSPSPVIVPPRVSSSNKSLNVKKKPVPKAGELLEALRTAPLPPLPERSPAIQVRSQHPYSNTISTKQLPVKPSRSPLLQTQPLSAPPSMNTFHSLPSPNGVISFSQRNRKAIPKLASPPPSQPLPLLPLHPFTSSNP